MKNLNVKELVLTLLVVTPIAYILGKIIGFNTAIWYDNITRTK